MIVLPIRKNKRDERNRLHGDSRMRGVRSSALHAHHAAVEETNVADAKPKVWERDWDAVTQLRNYCEQKDDQNGQD